MDTSIPTRLLENLLKIGSVDTASQYSKYLNYWPVLLIGLIFSILILPIIGKLATKFGITYKPGVKRKNREFDNPQKAIHEKETPALGGLAVTIPLLIAIPVFFRFDPVITAITIALSILVIGSLLDDLFNLPAKIQLGYQILAALVIAFSVIDLSGISFFTNDLLNLKQSLWSTNIFSMPISFVFPGDLILIFWILLCIDRKSVV